jgi:hypothetical protein
MEKTLKKNFSIAILSDNFFINYRYYNFINWLKIHNNINLECIFLIKKPKKIFNIISNLHKIPFWIMLYYEKLLINNSIHKKHLEIKNIKILCKKIIILKPYISKSGFFYKFSNSDVQKIKKLKLDLIIRFGGGILRGHLDKLTRLGIFSIHNGDPRVMRGGPSGFWEIVLGRKDSGYIIQKINNTLDAGNIILKDKIETKKYFLMNQSALYNASIKSLRSVISRILSNNFFYLSPIKYRLSKVYKKPRFWHIANYYFMILIIKLKLKNLIFSLKTNKFY